MAYRKGKFSTDDEAKISLAISVAKASHSFLTAAFGIYHAEMLEQVDNDDLHRVEVHSEVSNTLRDFGADVLSERERTLVQLMLKGHSAKAMARILEITPGTISIHRSNIYRKMQVTSLGELFGVFLDNLAVSRSQ